MSHAEPDLTVEGFAIAGGPAGAVEIRLVRPVGAPGPLPVVLYLPGAGDRPARELAARAGAAAVIVRHSRTARYPVAIEECYAALEWVAAHGPSEGLDPRRLAVAGDGAGGNLAAAVTIMAKQRSGPTLVAQLLHGPVTDAASLPESYAPDRASRAEITASPLRASLDDLAGLPPALVLVGEHDPLRDQAEAYAGRLRAAGVPVTAVRFLGVDRALGTAAILQGARFLAEALH